MKSNQYWKQRAELRMYEYHKQADKIADDIAESYISASEYISQETRKIFHTFQHESGLSEKAAREILNAITDKDKLNRLKSVVRKIKDPVIRQKMMSILSSPAYAYRIKRFEQLQEDIDRKLSELAEMEFNTTRNHYTDTAYEAYNRTMFDIQKGTGFGFQFSSMPIIRVAEILDNAWSSKHYSERIWSNSRDLSVKLKQELLTGFLTGRSYHKTAKEIQDQFEVGAFEARRLVRTESTYIANMAEIESYKESGIKKYRFLATLDIRTSEVCRNMDGKEFDVDKAVPGVNLPPLHPWCRSTTISTLNKQIMDKLQRRARDPVTGKTYLIPANITYNEWIKTVRSGGLSANGENSEIPKHQSPKLLEKIKNVDYNKAVKKLEQYEKIISRSDIENAVVITKDGEVWQCFGTSNRVFPDYDLGNKLKGAYVTHNHPISETEYSFSEEDYKLFKEYKLPVLRGVDEKYEYTFSTVNLYLDKSADSIFNMSLEDYRHEMSIENAKNGGVGYWRVKRK
ncbi:minor capsid protein [Acetivibrio sp. MSJd-27]|uniref:minor capsid protein n=1 Tax=Acetivibrio sp. MSJd-27 TaxID=2841523 RepID=UPI001C11FEDD|nr:minor capsid protein [Acetivibrio sp. MSJd-27]MBU5451104.1 minor capsid protein [Acetivibrio sp. MSJd-27]